MRAILGAAALALAIGLTAVPADAAGCIKGAIVGGAAGHLVHHGVLGAVAGCIIGHHRAKLRERAERAHALQPGHGPAPSQPPSY